MQHLNLSHAAASEMRVSQPAMVESLARNALKYVPRTSKLLEKHFSKVEKAPPRPAPIKPQKLYSCWGTV